MPWRRLLAVLQGQRILYMVGQHWQPVLMLWGLPAHINACAAAACTPFSREHASRVCWPRMAVVCNARAKQGQSCRRGLLTLGRVGTWTGWYMSICAEHDGRAPFAAASSVASAYTEGVLCERQQPCSTGAAQPRGHVPEPSWLTQLGMLRTALCWALWRQPMRRLVTGEEGGPVINSTCASMPLSSVSGPAGLALRPTAGHCSSRQGTPGCCR